MTEVHRAAARAQRWLMEAALPLWAEKGRDRGGAFHERLFFDGSPDLRCARRMRVQARQLYVYAEAATRGWWPQAMQVAHDGFEAMIRHCWGPDGRPGFVHTLTPDLKPLDAKRDTYDHAFGLFALAWYYRASGERLALDYAHQILDLLEHDMADRAHGGFLEGSPPTLPRRSDPHMHLLEAMLEWCEVAGPDRFLGVARTIVDLFRERFFDPKGHVLGENFAPDLTLAPGPSGQVVAPGHHFEWCWLLDWAARLGAGDATVEGQCLRRFALQHGLDADGFAIDECDRAGRQVRTSRRAWPQTELIKAYVTSARHGSREAADEAARLTERFLDTYLATRVPGLWMDQFDANGRGMAEAAPATTLYHVAVAFRELMLLADEAR